MRKNNIYNSTYIFLILKAGQLPLFIDKGILFVPIFTNLQRASIFKEKYVINNSTIIKVETSLAMSFLNNTLLENDYIPRIGVYEDALTCFNSNEFISGFYSYKDSNNTLLSTYVDKNISVKEVLNLLRDSSFYSLVTKEISKDSICRAIFDDSGILLGIENIEEKNISNLIIENDSLTIFTSSKDLEKLKKENSKYVIKKYYSLIQLKRDIDRGKLQINYLNINLSNKKFKIDINTLTDMIY